MIAVEGVVDRTGPRLDAYANRGELGPGTHRSERGDLVEPLQIEQALVGRVLQDAQTQIDLAGVSCGLRDQLRDERLATPDRSRLTIAASARSLRMTLSATSSSSSRSRARYTSPMPPLAISSRTSYRQPSVCPASTRPS